MGHKIPDDLSFVLIKNNLNNEIITSFLSDSRVW